MKFSMRLTVLIAESFGVSLRIPRPLPSSSMSNCTRNDSARGLLVLVALRAESKNWREERTGWSSGRDLRYWMKIREATYKQNAVKGFN